MSVFPHSTLIRRKRSSKRKESGAAILEYCLCLTLLFFFLFAILDLFNMSVATLVTDYAAYIAARGRALGYTDHIIGIKTELAAAATSGRDTSTVPLSPLAEWHEAQERALDYSRYGHSGFYGVNYKYWGSSSSSGAATSLQKSTGETSGGYVASAVYLTNFPSMFGDLFIPAPSAQGSDTRYNPNPNPGVNTRYTNTPENTAELKNFSLNYLESQ